MKHDTPLARVLGLAFLVALSVVIGACEEDRRRAAIDEDDDDDGSSDTDSDGDSDTDTDSDGTPGEPSFGSGSSFGSVEEMLDYLNEQRQAYDFHDRYKGFPFGGGQYHQSYTWPLTFDWDDGVAAAAQTEADAVAGSGTPSGQETVASGPGGETLFLDGLNSPHYMVSAKERAGAFDTQECALCNANPIMRMAVYYHDPGWDGPVLDTIGIGAADAGGGDTWWVMIFE